MPVMLPGHIFNNQFEARETLSPSHTFCNKYFQKVPKRVLLHFVTKVVTKNIYSI